MLFSVFIAALIPFFLAPVWTHELFKGSFERQRNIIALDNAAIVLGREERELFSFIKKTNSFISGLEKVHHPVHLAVRMGATEPNLKAQDLGLEMLIRELHSNVVAIATIRWSKASSMAMNEFQRMGVPGHIIERSPRVPIFELECSFCHLLSKWELNSPVLKTKIAVTNHKIENSVLVYSTVVSLENNDNPNYKVSILSGDDA